MLPLGVAAVLTGSSSIGKTLFNRVCDSFSKEQEKLIEGTPQKEINYDVGVKLLKDFLTETTDHIIEEIQALTAKDIPVPANLKVQLEKIVIDNSLLDVAAAKLVAQLGKDEIEQVGGSEWWRWRDGKPYRAEWLETTTHWEERKKKPDQAETLVLYLHGGAFYFGSPGTMRYQVQAWAKKMNARILTPHYRLAPQFPFPCAIQDALAAYQFLIKEHPPSRILLLGDSAGGNLCLSLLVILRDQKIPLPAGAILLSPWVDLTHSFPSILTDNAKDYIPKHGFRHKPSPSWPPPPFDDLENLTSRPNSSSPSRPSTPAKAGENASTEKSNGSKATITPPAPLLAGASGSQSPHPEHLIFKTEDGKETIVKEQIHMYTTNSMIGHPLVSLVNQGSLGGLCPLLITSGGAEVLRDEHTYIAHKAADPKEYPPSPAILERYPRQREALEKYPPTKVKFQLFEGCCHVVTALSITNPAKVMNRSIGSFARWAIQYAKDSADIDYGEDESICSGASDNSSLNMIAPSKSSAVSASERTADEVYYTTSIGSLKKVSKEAKKAALESGDVPLVPVERFEHNMIRQSVDTLSAKIYPLRPVSHFPCLSIPPTEIGTVKPGPLQFWLEGQAEADKKYGKLRKEMQRKQLEALIQNNQGDILMEKGEKPPPSSLYRRRNKDDIKPTATNESSVPATAWAWSNSIFKTKSFLGFKENAELEEMEKTDEKVKGVNGSSIPASANAAA